MADEDPSLCTLEGGFEIFGQAAAAKPTKGSLHDPTALGSGKAFGRVGALDDLDRLVPRGRNGITQFVASIAAISKHMGSQG